MTLNIASVNMPIWFAPMESATILNSVMNGGAAFQTTMSGVSVFKMYEAELTLPDATLKAFFSYLKAHNVGLAIEGLPLVASPGQPGYGVEGFSAPGDLKMLLTKAKADGAVVNDVAWDEPYAYGDVVTGIYSLQGLATQVAASTKIVKSLFPSARIGDIEPVTPSVANETSQLQSWFSAYAKANGAPFDFFQSDICSWETGWQTSLASVTSMARANGMTVSDIVDGAWNATSNAAWTTQASALAQELWSTPNLRPDGLVVQSWQAYPSETMNPALTGTLASVLQGVETLVRSGA